MAKVSDKTESVSERILPSQSLPSTRHASWQLDLPRVKKLCKILNPVRNRARGLLRLWRVGFGVNRVDL